MQSRYHLKWGWGGGGVGGWAAQRLKTSHQKRRRRQRRLRLWSNRMGRVGLFVKLGWTNQVNSFGASRRFNSANRKSRRVIGFFARFFQVTQQGSHRKFIEWARRTCQLPCDYITRLRKLHWKVLKLGTLVSLKTAQFFIPGTENWKSLTNRQVDENS